MTSNAGCKPRSGCLRKLISGLIGLSILAALCFIPFRTWLRTYLHDTHVSGISTWTALKTLRMGIENFQSEYHTFPIVDSDSRKSDTSIRSRGQLLQILLGRDITALNPRNLKFIDLPMAKERKYGLWQNGLEWVLNDYWGEPYHIVLDTNEDGKISNPEFGADQSDSKYVEKCRNSPPPPTLSAKVLIYSFGPDRDPQTWHDNICSWRL